jgi:hypothetical protein
MAEAYALDDRKPGETVASLHRRKAVIARRARICIFDYPFDNYRDNCALCHFGEPLILQLGIETTEGKVYGEICEKCAIKIIERLEKALDEHRKTVDKRKEQIREAKQEGRKADHRKTGERSEVRKGAGASDPRLRSEV